MRKSILDFTKVSLMLIFILCFIASLFSLGGIVSAYAESENNKSFAEICKEYTGDEYLFQEENTDSNKITNYESYVNTRFDVLNKNNTNASVSDEWILKIIPPILFEEKVKDFLYIGKKYGFYISYNEVEDCHLAYIILHLEKDIISGQYSRRIEPLYYERYKFNPVTKKASLIYKTNGTLKYYEKYSDVKNLYIKDVSFTGSLSNEMHLNQGEEGYIDDKDYGGYFYGNYYKFKGVSTQSGKTDFFVDTFKTAIGYIPIGYLTLGDAFAIADLAISLSQFQNDLKRDFRGEITNEKDYGFDFDEAYAKNQISKYGHLLKAAGTIMETDNYKNAVLFGIRNNCYIQNTFFIGYRNQDNFWNTRFAGRVKLDIVEEIEGVQDSSVIDIAKGVESLDYVRTFDNGEKTEVQESEDRSVYILADSNHYLRFKAPVKGTYTLKTMGGVANVITADKGVLTDLDNGINKQLKVDLEQNETFDFYISKKNKVSSANLSVLMEFTPNEIDVGQTKQLTIGPGKHDYLLFRSMNVATPFAYDISTEGSVSLQFAYNKYNNYMPNTISGDHLYGSKLAEFKGKYYLIVSNTTANDQTITITIDGIDNVSPHDIISENIIDQRVYAFSSPFTSGVNLSYESEAPVTMRIYDANHNQIAWSSDSSVKELLFPAEANKTYFVVLSNLLYAPKPINLSFNYVAVNLDLGINEITNSYDGLLTKFSTHDTAATYMVQSEMVLRIYNAEWQEILPTSNNEYRFDANSDYYIYATGNKTVFDIDIDFKSTETTAGVFDGSGMVLIKYVPSRTTAYKVNGATNVEWYNSSLHRHNAYLSAGNTYYLKLVGNIGEQYNVSIVRNANGIQINSGLSIGEGLYYFNITESGIYKLWVTCPETMTTAITITDDVGNVVIDDIQLINESIDLNLDAGLYYLDLSLTNGTKASIRINKQ